MQYKVCYKDWGITFGKANINHLYLVLLEKKTKLNFNFFFDTQVSQLASLANQLQTQ